MGFLNNMKAAMAAPGRMDPAGAMASRRALESQAREQNRILSIGHAGTAVIRGHVDAGENVAGNPVWIFNLQVTPVGGAAYDVEHREIVSSLAMSSYGDGTSLACRIDPPDPYTGASPYT
jgi:hypothetical protein